ncbi:MAG: RNA methyltransferase [Ahrensia sp.]|nr:RNA methyltransferase [Ahrensia sp.]
MLIPIDHPDDNRIAHYKDFRERDLVRNKRQFIAEGTTVIQALQSQNRFKLRSLLILENRLDGISHIISSCDDDMPIYVVAKPIMDQIAGFDMHRGVLGLADAPKDIDEPPVFQPQCKRIVVLVGLSNHDNVGSIFRNCAAFGVDAVLMDSQTCDPLYRKAIRVSVGGVFKIPFFRFETMADILTLLENNNFKTIALSPTGAMDMADWTPPDKAALVLGTEGQGLPPTLLSSMTSVRIDMSDDFDSLNVATTSGIVLHHLFKNQR